ncbi:MAG: hypothetical protein PHI59_03410 [Candidatus Omnitrophica bacterium]|nr:hypothetical protein [Candidatus Omnitrophota bacterium]
MMDFINAKIKKLTVVDIGLVKLSVFFFTIIIVKLIPRLLNISYLALVILLLAAASVPMYGIWIKK